MRTLRISIRKRGDSIGEIFDIIKWKNLNNIDYPEDDGLSDLRLTICISWKEPQQFEATAKPLISNKVETTHTIRFRTCDIQTMELIQDLT